MAKHSRVTLLFVAGALLFVMLISAFYISSNANHDCIGENCAICHQIDLYENMHKALSIAFAVCGIADLIVVAYIGCVSVMSAATAQDTLISLKVELLN